MRDNIRKLLLSQNRDDNRIGLQMATDKELLSMVNPSGNEPPFTFSKDKCHLYFSIGEDEAAYLLADNLAIARCNFTIARCKEAWKEYAPFFERTKILQNVWRISIS